MEPVHDLIPSVPNRARQRRVVLVIATVLAVTGGIATQRVGAPGLTPQALLSAAQEFAGAHPSARFTGETTVTYADDEDEATDSDLGSTTTSKGRITGQVQDTTHSRVVEDDGSDGAMETIVFGQSMYTRYADSAGGLNSEQFAKETITNFAAFRDDLEQLDPTAILRKATNPAAMTRDGNHATVTVNLDPDKIFGKGASKDIKTFVMQITVVDGARIEATKQTWHGPGLDGTVTMRFSDWGSDVNVVEPAATEVDATPDIAEEAIGGYHDSTLVMPKTIPSGWAMDYADLISADDSDEGCAQVEVDFDAVHDDSDDAPYADTYLLPTSCAGPFGGLGVIAFNAGTHRGAIETDADGSFVQLEIDGKSTLEIDTNLPPAQIAAMFAELVPLDLAHGPAPAGPAV